MRCYSTNLVCAQLLVGFEKTVSCIISTLLKSSWDLIEKLSLQLN